MTFEITDAAAPVSAATDVHLPGRERLARARRATRAEFAALGLMGGAWGVHVPSVKAAYGLDEMSLSAVLFAAALGAVLSLFAAGRVIGRIGVGRAAASAAVAMGAMLALVLAWPSYAMLLAAMVLFGAAASLFDVAINTEGTALESMSGRTIMSSLHAMFSVGAMAGAALAGTMLRLGVPSGWQLAAIGIVVAAGAAWSSRAMLDAHPEPQGAEPQAHFAWPRGVLLVIGLMIFAGMSAEGAMYDWCVLYLKQELGMTQQAAAIGYAAFTGAMAAARFAGDAVRARVPEPRLLCVSAGLAALSMTVLLVCAQPGIAIAGYALIGIGLAPVVPILFNAATRVPGPSRAAAIAAVSSIGYAGFMAGPPLIGAIAKSVSLSAAMSVVVVAAALLAIGARKLP